MNVSAKLFFEVNYWIFHRQKHTKKIDIQKNTSWGKIIKVICSFIRTPIIYPQRQQKQHTAEKNNENNKIVRVCFSSKSPHSCRFCLFEKPLKANVEKSISLITRYLYREVGRCMWKMLHTKKETCYFSSGERNWCFANQDLCAHKLFLMWKNALFSYSKLHYKRGKNMK